MSYVYSKDKLERLWITQHENDRYYVLYQMKENGRWMGGWDKMMSAESLRKYIAGQKRWQG